MRIVIFLTDGTPTAGEQAPDRILEKVAERNTGKARIFVVGVGDDVNAHLLDRLAEMSDGSSGYVGEDEEIDVKVAALFNRLSNPVLADARLAFGDLKTTAVYPRTMPALFEGSDIMVAGRYAGGGKHTVTLSGTLAGTPREFRCTADVPGKPADGANTEFVASLWAARSIGFLLREIRLHGPNKELIEEVVRLSRRFGIVTEYTEFIAEAPDDIRPEDALARAEGRMKEANAMKSGRWAVVQAKNDMELQQRVVAAPSVNAFLDQSGERREAGNVRQVGRKAFYRRNDTWVEAAEAGDRKERKVKLFSPEYFSLVAGDEGFRQAQEIGAEMSVNVGNERIVVEK
jgi:Ca-activated chloride channel family protein